MYWDRKKKETTLDESEVFLFFLAQYISRSTSIYRALYCGKIEIQTSHLYLYIYIYIYIYIYTSYKPRFLGLQCNLRSDPWPMQARSALTISELKWKTPAIPPPPIPPLDIQLLSSFQQRFERWGILCKHCNLRVIGNIFAHLLQRRS